MCHTLFYTWYILMTAARLLYNFERIPLSTSTSTGTSARLLLLALWARVCTAVQHVCYMRCPYKYSDCSTMLLWYRRVCRKPCCCDEHVACTAQCCCTTPHVLVHLEVVRSTSTIFCRLLLTPYPEPCRTCTCTAVCMYQATFAVRT